MAYLNNREGLKSPYEQVMQDIRDVNPALFSKLGELVELHIAYGVPDTELSKVSGIKLSLVKTAIFAYYGVEPIKMMMKL